MKTLPLFAFITIICSTAGLAQSNSVKKPQPKNSFLVNPSLPYVYLEVDHIGPRVPNRDGEPTIGIFLRLHNNSTIPIIVDTFGRPPESKDDQCGVFDNVVANRPSFGESGGETIDISGIDISGMSKVDLASIFAPPAAGPQKPAPQPSTKAEVGGSMPPGYDFEVGSMATLGPGQSIYFSLPLDHVSSKWHAEIPFRFDLRIRTPVRSAQNFIALYQGDLAGKMPHAVQY
jgi:hypothetical protein